jgi:predicted nucleotide-binding protein (sugar kinase/HSP70/actin superfamily)
MFPELLKGMSPELKKHMQGKSCFNFKKVEPDLFKELKELTRLSIERTRKAKNTGEI